MDYIEMARRMRPLMEDTAKGLDDETAITVPFMFEAWKAGREYSAGDRVRYGEKLYKALQTHISQAEWTPDAATSLYAEVLPGQDGEIGEWVQPDSTNPYKTGDRVRHNGKTWESTIDNNIWEPGVYGWQEIEGGKDD